MKPYLYFPGTLPIIVSVPHAGIYVPDNIHQRLVLSAQQLPDTDWHVEQLYAFAREMGVHMLVATHSRYVIDLNRGPTNESLYPGKFTTGLCPLTTFAGKPIYHHHQEPNAEEIQTRLTAYWAPYHQQLRSLIQQLKQHHKRVVVFDAHSIRSEVPTLFEGRLPDLNLGTAEGHSAHPELTAALATYCARSRYSSVCNGRFKGGYITREYGKPADGVDALQLELAQINYMNEDYPYTYDEKKSSEITGSFTRIIFYSFKMDCTQQ